MVTAMAAAVPAATLLLTGTFFSASLRAQAQPTAPPAQASGKVDAAELYKQKCQVCHMADGNSQMMPNMSFADGVWKNGSSVKEVSNTIANGVPGTAMMPFKTQLSEQEIEALARFVRKFDKKLK
ncbi:MAG TPA: c-type cytochrome [Vicinamibacterales bacterium]